MNCPICGNCDILNVCSGCGFSRVEYNMPEVCVDCGYVLCVCDLLDDGYSPAELQQIVDMFLRESQDESEPVIMEYDEGF